MNFGVRVDCNVIIGLGHVKRCLTLAKEFILNGHEVTFLMRCAPHVVKTDIVRLGAKLVLIKDDELDIISWLKENQQPHLVVDHYKIDYRWHEMVRPFTSSIGVIDDLANRKLDCDWLLDQNFYIAPDCRYTNLVADSCIKLLGPDFALLREEFRGNFSKNNRSAIKDSRFKVLVFFGGGDQTDICLEAMHALVNSSIDNLEVSVVISSLNPRRKLITSFASQYKSTFICMEDVDNISELMMSSDLCLGAGGSISLERCYVGLPSLVLVVAKNQIETTEAYANIGAIDYLGISGADDRYLMLNRLMYYYENQVELEHMRKSCRTVFTIGSLGAKHAIEQISVILECNNRS